MTLSVFMVGCGAFARRYHLPAFDHDDQVRIAAIFDPSPAAETLALAQRHGAPVCARLEDLPAPAGDRRDTFAIVTTPHTLHAAHVDAVLDLGLAVLVDKPFVMHTADAVRLADRAEQLGLCNAVAYNRRFDRSCQRARELIRQGRIGAPRFVQTVQLGYERAGWFLVPELGGGGPYTGRASHMADLVPWLLDRQPTRLRSRLRASSPQRSDHGGFIEVQFDELEWQMTCVEEGWHMWDEVRIFGEDGLIELRRPLNMPIGWSLDCMTERMAQRETLQADPTPGGATLDFMRAMRDREARVACSFRDAIPSVRIVERAFESARDGERWLGLRGQEPGRSPNQPPSPQSKTGQPL
jgi:predicted dehydrogenase